MSNILVKKNMNNFIDKEKAVMIGHAVGDALGVPVEFRKRENLEKLCKKHLNFKEKIMTKPHSWTYEENEHCVEEVFKNFVVNKEFDYETIITKLYIHFDGEIKKSSIKMKLQNIKYLLNTYSVPNTLMIAALENASEDNIHAFLVIAKKYNYIF